MSNDRNAFVIIGTVSFDPNLRYTQSGKAVCTAKIKTIRTTADGEQKTSYHEFTLWEKDAEDFAKVKVGARVEVRGFIGAEKVNTARDGKEFEKWMPALKVTRIGPEGASASPAQAKRQEPRVGSLDDDIPFIHCDATNPADVGIGVHPWARPRWST